MSELNKNTFGIAIVGLVSGLLVFALAFLAGAYLLCVKYQICLFEPDKYL